MIFEIGLYLQTCSYRSLKCLKLWLQEHSTKFDFHLVSADECDKRESSHQDKATSGQ